MPCQVHAARAIIIPASVDGAAAQCLVADATDAATGSIADQSGLDRKPQVGVFYFARPALASSCGEDAWPLLPCGNSGVSVPSPGGLLAQIRPATVSPCSVPAGTRAFRDVVCVALCFQPAETGLAFASTAAEEEKEPAGGDAEFTMPPDYEVDEVD